MVTRAKRKPKPRETYQLQVLRAAMCLWESQVYASTPKAREKNVKKATDVLLSATERWIYSSERKPVRF